MFISQSAGLISQESVVASLVEKDDTGILGHMALKLDMKSRKDWKGLALQLNVPHRVLRNLGSHQKHNSSLMLLKYIPIFDPEMTLAHLKNCLISIGRQDVGLIFDKGGIPGSIYKFVHYFNLCYYMAGNLSLVMFAVRADYIQNILKFTRQPGGQSDIV